MASRDWAVAVASLLAAFTIVVGAVAELGEQSRFRTAVDPMATVIVGSLIVGWVRRRRSRQSQAEAVGS